MTTPRWNDPKAVQAAIQRNRESRGTDPLWWRHTETVEEPTRRRTKMKRYLVAMLILICAWIVASIGIRIFGILVFGLRNTEISAGVVSALAAVAVAIWIWRDDLF
jgi:small neutral amino acid transporter SnatA (MarC family)